MKTYLKNLLVEIQSVYNALSQTTVWVLMLPALLMLAFTDVTLLITMLQWAAFVFVFLGVSIVLSMVCLPQIKLSRLVALAVNDKHLPAAIIVLGVLLFFASLVFSTIYWAKA